MVKSGTKGKGKTSPKETKTKFKIPNNNKIPQHKKPHKKPADLGLLRTHLYWRHLFQKEGIQLMVVDWVPASTAGGGSTKGKNDLWFDLVHGRIPGVLNVTVFVLGRGGWVCWENFSECEAKPKLAQATSCCWDWMWRCNCDGRREVCIWIQG